MTSFVVPAPVVEAVETTLAVQLPLRTACRSLTVTTPRALDMVGAATVTAPRLALSGVATVSSPPLTAKVVGVGPVFAPRGLAGPTRIPAAATRMPAGGHQVAGRRPPRRRRSAHAVAGARLPLRPLSLATMRSRSEEHTSELQSRENLV